MSKEKSHQRKIEIIREAAVEYVPGTWMTPIRSYIEEGKLPKDLHKAEVVTHKAREYTVIGGRLFKRGLSTPLLECLAPDEAALILQEIYEGDLKPRMDENALSR